jgi:hypothetical protein
MTTVHHDGSPKFIFWNQQLGVDDPAPGRFSTITDRAPEFPLCLFRKMAIESVTGFAVASEF